MNLGVALHLQKLLKMRRDAPVIMTRDADYAVSAAQRLETVSKSKAVITSYSIHYTKLYDFLAGQLIPTLELPLQLNNLV